MGLSANEIVDQYPTITLADVHAAMAYYWGNRDTIEDALKREARVEEEFRNKHPGKLRERMRHQTVG